MVLERTAVSKPVQTLATVILIGCFLLSNCCVLSGCTSSTKRYEPDTLRVNLGTEPPGIDWHVCTDSTSLDVVSNLMAGLTQYRNDLSIEPATAQSWDVLDGGKTYRFHLRQDALWSDGTPVTAYDFEYAWRRLLDPATAAEYAFFLYDVKNAYEFNSSKTKDFASVGAHAIDAHTFEVTLKRPVAYFLCLVAFCPTYPMRRDLITKYGNRWTDPQYMVSNGPFVLNSWAHEYKIELGVNPHYFGNKPKIKKIKMFMIPEQSTAFALYQNDELDLIDNRSFPTADVACMQNSPEYHHCALLRNNYIGFNINKAPFNDVRVRKAFAYAIDRNIFPAILRRGECPTTTWIPPELAGYDKTTGIDFDPAKARLLFAQAGYKNGNGFPHVELLYPTREDTRLVVEAIQDELKRNLNIHIDLLNQEWKVYLETLRRDPPPVFRNNWGADYPDPETFMNVFSSQNGNNHTCFASRIYDDLIARAATEQNPTRRAQLYCQADHLLCKEVVPIIPTFLATQNMLIKPWVHGECINALDLQFYKNISISPQ